MDPERWRQVEQLYHSAEELQPDRREAFLALACEGDKELQADIWSLLNQTPSTELLGGNVWKVAEDLLTGPSPGLLVPGLHFGPYRIEAILGTGGMGEVYQAHDTRLDRTVAVKILRSEGPIDAVRRARFQREARAASALNHPNICTVYDIGEYEKQPYLVMERLQGETLRERLGTGPLPQEELLDLAIQISDALDAAHSNGILHRDIKDANVFVTSRREAKVLDFGIAKVMERTAVAGASSYERTTSPTMLLTEAGAAIGTVAYMSPEQARGERLDARSDLFSFAVLLYQMATGRLPFEGKTPAIVFAAILNEKPKAIRHLRPELSRKLEHIVESALAKEREGRPHSAREMRSALQRAKRELESGVPFSGPLDFWRSRRVPLLFTALLATLLMVIVTTQLWMRDRSVPEVRSLAVMPFQNVSGDASQEYFAEGMTEALIGDLSKISALRVIRGSRKAVRDTARELHVDDIVDGSVARSGDQVRFSASLVQATTQRSLWGGNYQRSMQDVPSLQSEVAGDIIDKLNVRLTAQEKALLGKPIPVNPKAYEAYLRGRQFANRQTQSELRRAEEEFRLCTEESPNYAPGYAGLADTYSNLSWFGFIPPLDVLEVAKAAATKALQIDPTLAEGHISLAIITGFAEWNWPAAEKELEKAIALNPRLADGYHWHGHLLEALDQLDGGLAEIQHAHALDPLSPLFDKDLALAYYYRRDYDRALAETRKILEVEPGFWRGHMTMGQVYLQKRMPREAIPEFEQARILSGSGALPTAGLAHAYALSGRDVEARRLLKELEDRSKTTYVLPEAIAEIHLALGENDLALQWLEKACAYHAPRFAWLVLRDPNYVRLRGEPRFRALLQKMRLPLPS